MPEVKVQRDTKVFLSTNEDEAGQLKTLLLLGNWAKQPWMEEMYAALTANGVINVGVVYDSERLEDELAVDAL